MMTLAEMCEALDGKSGRVPMPPYRIEFLYADRDTEPLEEDGEINLRDSYPDATFVLRAQNVNAARAEARARWDRERTDAMDGYVVYQADGICVHGLNLHDPAEHIWPDDSTDGSACADA